MATAFLSPGVVSTPKELHAFGEVMKAAANTYAGVEMITDLLSTNARGTEEQGDIDDAASMVLGRVAAALKLVDQRATPAEAQAYRKLLREVTRATTEASGSGLFGRGEKVSDDERAYLAKLDQILG